MRAIRPKVTMINPAMRLIQVIVFCPTFLRKNVTPSLKINHHRVAPIKIPVTRTAASANFSDTSTSPRPAKTAIKDRIVSGFERVKKKVEMKSERIERWATLPFVTSAVLAKKVLIPRKIKKQPPSKWIQKCCAVRKSDTNVKLNAAIMP